MRRTAVCTRERLRGGPSELLNRVVLRGKCCMALRVVWLRCNDSPAIGDKAGSGGRSDRHIYEFTA